MAKTPPISEAEILRDQRDQLAELRRRAGNPNLARRVRDLEVVVEAGATIGGVAGVAGAGSTSAAAWFWDAGVTVVFPTGMFDQPPAVALASIMGGTVTLCGLISLSATSMTIRSLRIGASPAGTTSTYIVRRRNV